MMDDEKEDALNPSEDGQGVMNFTTFRFIN